MVLIFSTPSALHDASKAENMEFSAETTFATGSDLAAAMRRAEAAHGEHEKRTGVRDANWSDWYAEYMVAEQSGGKLPV